MSRKKADQPLGKVDRPFLITLTILIAFGLVMVFSASMYDATVNNEPGYSTFLKQFSFIVGGAFIMMWISRKNYRLLNSRRLTFILMCFAVVLLLMVFIPGIGVEVNGAKRWINLVVTRFQPSELAKVIGILYLSCLLSKEPELLKDTPYGDFKFGKRYGEECTGWKGFKKALPKWRVIRCFLPIAVLCLFTIIEPSMSAALAIGFGMFCVLYYGGIRLRTMIPIIGTGGLAVAVALIREPWRIERIMVLFGKGSIDYQITQSLLAIGTGGIIGQGLGNGKQKLLFLPELQNDFIFANIGEETGYQITQSLLAIGTGGIIGQGLGNGKQKLLFLPELQNDFIFANIGEETGLIGCLFVIGLYAYLIYRGFKIAKAAPDRFAYLYTASVMTLIAFQVFVNIGVAISVLPVTGMALPFVSAGGTSAIILLIMMGPILNISRQVDLNKRRGRKE